ncbi:MAG: hypothetical protein M1817_002338 [Caeruleum heppii]|nr:MAG: hypothetical protein M1817_003477 [Caeruleum heppii]KAI9673700.1 MAG: hypothetical protein M1817_002338 [Caeruleum heppii]
MSHPRQAADFALFSSLRYDTALLQSEANTLLSANTSQPSPLYMVRYHRDRLEAASRYFGWDEVTAKLTGAEGLRWLDVALIAKAQETESRKEGGPLKLRVQVDHVGEFSIESTSTSAVPLDRMFPTRLEFSQSLMTSSKTGGALLLGKDEELPQKSPNGSTSAPWPVYLDKVPTTPSPFTQFKTTSRAMYEDARTRVGIKSFKESAEVILWNAARQLMEGSLTSIFMFRNGRCVTPSAISGGQAGTTRRWLIEQGLCEEDTISLDSVQDGEDCYLSNGVKGVIWGRIVLQTGLTGE